MRFHRFCGDAEGLNLEELPKLPLSVLSLSLKCLWFTVCAAVKSCQLMKMFWHDEEHDGISCLGPWNIGTSYIRFL